MTVIRVVTPLIDTAPGEVTVGRVEVVNESSSVTTYTVRVVGTGSETTATPFDVHVEAGQTVICDVPMRIATTLGIGQHAAAFEVSSSRPGEEALLSAFTVSIASVERVLLTAIPSTIRARRRARFHLDVANNEITPVAIDLAGTAPDVEVEFTPDRFDLAPGQRVVATGKVKGPRHWSGEPTQHNLLLSATGRAATTSITAPYIQRPLFAHRLRMVLAAVTVVALWVGAIVGVWLWWDNRDDSIADAATKIVAVDTDGDGIPDTFFDAQGNPITGTDTNGDGIPDTFVDAQGNPIRGVDTDGDGIPDTFVDSNGNPIEGPNAGNDGEAAAPRPTSTEVRGTVVADGDVDDVQVTMAPIALGAPPPPTATPIGFANPDRDAPTKIWPARFATVQTGQSQRRITQPVAPLSTTPAVDGIWLFGDVPLGQSYEIVFAKPGYDTQSFAFTPPEDGSAIDLDVTLEASRGSLSGRVSSPAGALGGAEVTISDGTLTFTTTAATNGDIGSWTLEGVSTPAVYTVTSTLRGYGTQVVQVSLVGGENRTGANLIMQPGVGTISGRILSETGDPLGGATVTATNGEVSRTSTSLTGGDIGSYSVPQLALPGPYTLTVELDGYVTQTRRVSLNGSVPDIDFDLVGSSLTLTGLVTGPDGTGIESAGVTLSTGDLRFRVSTTSAPDRGAYRVEDLPSGLYTVTFQHFEHVSATEFVTLRAGVPPAPLNVTLQRSAGPPDVGTGSLRVEVVDRNTTAGSTVTREVRNATVTVVNFTTRARVAQETQESNNFRFDNLPIGTYAVSVTAPFYNDSPSRLVTVGLTEAFAEFDMIRLGAANGRLVDPTDATRRFNNVGVSLFLEPRSVGDSPYFVTRTGLNSVWQTTPDALITGTYSIQVDPNAAGLRGWVVRNDQTLDAEVTGPSPAMKFVVPDDAIEPIEVGDIEADPYPNISGVVYQPILNPAITPARTDLVPIDNSGLTVTMACPGGTPTLATITDEQTTISGTLYDTFRIPKEIVGGNDLIGDCTLTYEATGFAPVTLPLNGVDAGTGTVAVNRQLNAALTAPAPNIRGSVFWTDAGAPAASRQIFLDGVLVSTNRTTAFGPGVDTALPPVLSGAASATSATSAEGRGRWSLPGQVFGPADYSFTTANFDPAVVTITIDENGVQLPPSTNSNAGVTGNTATGFAVELRAPRNGTINGTIAIESSRPQIAADFDNIVVSATSPGGTPITQTATAPASGEAATTLFRPTPSTFRIINAGAGTWTINFTEPNNYDFFGTGASERRPTQAPGDDLTTASNSLVELATLELTLVGTVAAGSPAITAAPTISLTPVGAVQGGAPITGLVLPLKPAPNADANIFFSDNIAVATTAPAGTSVQYDLDVTLAGYDTTATQNLPVDFLAGQVVPRTITLPRLGSVRGAVVGNLGPSTVEDLPINGTATDDPATRVTVTPISGDGLAPNGLSFTPTIVGNTYTFSRPTGWFRIDVASVGFEPTSRDVQIRNDIDARSDFELAIVPGSINLSVVSALAGGTAVDGAEYELTPGICVNPITAGEPNGTIGGGPAANNTVVAGLTPGAYCLEVRKYTTVFDPDNPAASRVEAAFPAIATITVGRSTTSLPIAPLGLTTHAPIGATTTVRTPLPAIRPSVTGTVRAENRNGAPVPLPSSIVLDIDYADTVLEVSNEPGGAIPNTETRNAAATVTPTPGSSTATYTFSNVPVGVHSITPRAITGFTPRASPVDVTVGTSGGFGPTPANDIVFLVDPLDVVVQLSGDATGVFLFPPGTPTLTSPIGVSYPAVYDPIVQRLTFRGVAPEIGNFQLTIADPLHTYVPAQLSFAVPVLTTPAPPADRVQTVPITATASMGRITGSLQQRDTSSLTGGMGAGTTITLTPAGGTTPIVTTGVSSSYSFDVPAGTYNITAQRSGYTQPVYTVTVTNGQIVSENLRIDRLAPITATVIAPTAVPDDTSIWLVVNNNPADDIPLARVGITNQWRLDAAPGAYRRVEARAPGYRTGSDPATVNPVLNLNIGTQFNPNFTLLPRTLTVNVVDTVAPPALVGVSVAISVGATTVTDTASPYTFVSTDAAPAIPVTGVGTAIVTATSRRTNSATVQDLLTQAIDVPLAPFVTATGSVAISAGNPEGNQALPIIWAESGTTRIFGSVTAIGAYVIDDIPNNLTTGADRIWTINYDKLGVGTATGLPFTVTATSASNITPGDLTPTPVMIPVTFTVSADAPAGPLAGATITVAGTSPIVGVPTSPGPTPPAGTVTVSVPENRTTWTAAINGFVTSPNQTLPTFTRPATGFGSRDPATATVTLISRSLTLNVSTTGLAQVVISCPAAATCPTLPSGPATGGAFTFVAPIAAGVYPITATRGSDSGTATVTVATAGGLGVLSAATITLA